MVGEALVPLGVHFGPSDPITTHPPVRWTRRLRSPHRLGVGRLERITARQVSLSTGIPEFGPGGRLQSQGSSGRQLGRFPAVDITIHTAPLMASAVVLDSASSAAASPLDLESLSVRELIRELAATEALLRRHPYDGGRGPTVRLQARIVGELRRRGPRPDPRAQRHVPVVADGGALARE